MKKSDKEFTKKEAFQMALSYLEMSESTGDLTTLTDFLKQQANSPDPVPVGWIQNYSAKQLKQSEEDWTLVWLSSKEHPEFLPLYLRNLK